MFSFPFLTDSPAPQASREGVLTRWGNGVANMDNTEAQLGKRIIGRQWGQATPAQALLCLSLFPAARCAAPVGNPDNLVITFLSEDKPAIVDHWRSKCSVKEANALIRLLDKDYGTAGKERFLARCAWLVTADQTALQAFLRTLDLPKPNGGRVQIPGKQGCTGFLMQTELFPFIRKPAPVAPVDDGCDIPSMFSGD